MIKRGKILRDAIAGTGLLMAEGKQYRFALDSVWKSEALPRPGMVVDVEVDAAGTVKGITVVPDPEPAKERLEWSGAIAREKGEVVAGRPSAWFAVATLAATGTLAVSWFSLTSASIQIPLLGRLDFTFWQMLGLLNAGNVIELLDRHNQPSAGFYGLMAVVALAGPFIPYFWKDKRAVLGGLLPVIFMGIVGLAVRSSIETALIGGLPTSQAQGETLKTVSLGPGAYLATLVSVYLAFAVVRGLVAPTPAEGREQPKVQRKAA